MNTTENMYFNQRIGKMRSWEEMTMIVEQSIIIRKTTKEQLRESAMIWVLGYNGFDKIFANSNYNNTSILLIACYYYYIQIPKETCSD